MFKTKEAVAVVGETREDAAYRELTAYQNRLRQLKEQRVLAGQALDTASPQAVAACEAEVKRLDAGIKTAELEESSARRKYDDLHAAAVAQRRAEDRAQIEADQADVCRQYEAKRAEVQEAQAAFETRLVELASLDSRLTELTKAGSALGAHLGAPVGGLFRWDFPAHVLHHGQSKYGVSVGASTECEWTIAPESPFRRRVAEILKRR